ncbi:CPBP family intramembrane glutamic endopeptidase [Pseudomonas huanghezhanensis]|uniref:CPBP family intramembrane glutamic endopeptidase n=1 Tax=Pseudomonas huanghezhanensis TaxID=3002903 RepID=UPI0022860720|nr:CPBP family intramembrane glutamic endopeptidase [Pseudomonas sp. BSw22131]
MPALRWTTLALLTLGYVVALIYGQLSLPVVVTLGLLIMAGICVNHFRHWAVLAFGHALFIAVAIGLASHWLPGFLNARAIAAVRMSPDAAPFSMFLNLDKPLIGFWVVLACPWVFYRAATGRSLLSTAVVLLITTGICMATAVGLGMIAWTPKWPEHAGIWIFNNLLLVTLTEELLFRGYIQGGLSRLFERVPGGDVLAIAVASALFGLAHFGAGWEWVVLAGLAGAGYGIAFKLGGLTAAVLTHFGLNLVHLTLFTYPMFNR